MHFIIKNIFDRNECKIPIGCLTFIFYQKYFYDKIDLRLFYFDVMKSMGNQVSISERSYTWIKERGEALAHQTFTCSPSKRQTLEKF